jgi:hypothetical protein
MDVHVGDVFPIRPVHVENNLAGAGGAAGIDHLKIVERHVWRVQLDHECRRRRRLKVEFRARPSAPRVPRLVDTVVVVGRGGAPSRDVHHKVGINPSISASKDETISRSVRIGASETCHIRIVFPGSGLALGLGLRVGIRARLADVVDIGARHASCGCLSKHDPPR